MGDFSLPLAVPVVAARFLSFRRSDTNGGPGRGLPARSSELRSGWHRSRHVRPDLRSHASISSDNLIGDRLAEPFIFPEAGMDDDIRRRAVVDVDSASDASVDRTL